MFAEIEKIPVKKAGGLRTKHVWGWVVILEKWSLRINSSWNHLISDSTNQSVNWSPRQLIMESVNQKVDQQHNKCYLLVNQFYKNRDDRRLWEVVNERKRFSLFVFIFIFFDFSRLLVILCMASVWSIFEMWMQTKTISPWFPDSHLNTYWPVYSTIYLKLY